MIINMEKLAIFSSQDHEIHLKLYYVLSYSYSLNFPKWIALFHDFFTLYCRRYAYERDISEKSLATYASPWQWLGEGRIKTCYEIAQVPTSCRELFDVRSSLVWIWNGFAYIEKCLKRQISLIMQWQGHVMLDGGSISQSVSQAVAGMETEADEPALILLWTKSTLCLFPNANLWGFTEKFRIFTKQTLFIRNPGKLELQAWR